MLRKARDSFESRGDRLRQQGLERQGEIGKPQDSARTSRLAGWGRLLHPFKTLAESSAALGCVKAKPAYPQLPDRVSDTNEMSVVQDAVARALESAGVEVVQVDRMVEEAFLTLVDLDPGWKTPVRNEIQLPVVPAMNTPGGKDEPTQLANRARETSPFAVQTRSRTARSHPRRCSSSPMMTGA